MFGLCSGELWWGVWLTLGENRSVQNTLRACRWSRDAVLRSTIAYISKSWVTAAWCFSQDTCRLSDVGQLRSGYSLQCCRIRHVLSVYILLGIGQLLNLSDGSGDIFNLSILWWCPPHCVNYTLTDDLKLAISFDIIFTCSYFVTIALQTDRRQTTSYDKSGTL